jgi:hypothetical protein
MAVRIFQRKLLSTQVTEVGVAPEKKVEFQKYIIKLK